MAVAAREVARRQLAPAGEQQHRGAARVAKHDALAAVAGQRLEAQRRAERRAARKHAAGQVEGTPRLKRLFV